jgi:hypothetical protein
MLVIYLYGPINFFAKPMDLPCLPWFGTWAHKWVASDIGELEVHNTLCRIFVKELAVFMKEPAKN